jgi:hypothetical protein
MTKHVIPRYKLILCYDLRVADTEEYYQFIMDELIPAAQDMGLYFFRVFHTLWGDYPIRQAEFVAEDLETVHNALHSEAWGRLEDKLREHVTNYSRKTIQFRPGFQL